jgi:hypothetical protein
MLVYLTDVRGERVVLIGVTHGTPDSLPAP